MQTSADMAESEITQGPQRILLAAENVVDDVSLASWLQHEGFDVLAVMDGHEALQIVTSSWQPDVVVLDLTLPEMNGLAVCEQIRAKDQRVVILVLGDGSEGDEVRSLEAGADDYVAKRFSPEVLLARVRTRLRSRRASGNQRILQPGDLWLDAKNYATRVKGEWVDLRPQEFRLLIALAQSSGVPVSRRELIRRAGATWRSASSRTVDIHISRIRARIEPSSDYTYIHSVRGFGYRFEPVSRAAAVSGQTSPEKRTGRDAL